MKFMISVDCEGVSCICGTPKKSLSNSASYKKACIYAVNETNACISALFDSGASKVFVWDSHGQGFNLDYESLDKRCVIINGTGFKSRLPLLDETFSGLLMVGYHSMEGAKNSILSHTYSSKAYKAIKVENRAYGEIGLDASVAGEYGVPLIFLSSDWAGCKEGKKIMPWIKVVEAKKAITNNSAISDHPLKVCNNIYDKTILAVKEIDKMKPFKFNHPVLIEIEYKSRLTTLKAILKKRRGWKIKGAKRIYKRLCSMKEWSV